jgi:hypothetical protein
MTRPFVWTLIGCLAAATVVGATYAYPEWPLEAGFDFWNAPQYESEIEQCRRLNEELDRIRIATQNRLEMKQAIARLVFDKRLTLDQGARHVRDLGDCGPIFLAMLRRIYPGVSDDELYCRNLIDTVKSLPLPEGERTRAVDWLNNELKALRQNGRGQVILAD